MALNKKMHPRNIYRNPPNFKDLALKDEEFRQFAKVDLRGKVGIDFKNPDALRALTRALLRHDWKLNVTIPQNNLVPTLPLRLNYILWIEDLMASLGSNGPDTSVCGMDIGTGASCIYPLLAAKKNSWQMVGTEKNQISFAHAEENVRNNGLESLISVCKVSGETILSEALEKHKGKVFDFTMCNPPFFSSEEELEATEKSRSATTPRPPPNNARTGSIHEVVVEGGEVAFVKRMLEEYDQLKDRIKIMSTMLGRKASLSKVKEAVREKGVTNIAQMEFCQGKVTRWGVAWSSGFNLSNTQKTSPANSKKEKPRPPLSYTIIRSERDTNFSFNNTVAEVQAILDELQMQLKPVIKKEGSVGFHVTALSNTWSNQRRKRREKLRQHSESSDIPHDGSGGTPQSAEEKERGAEHLPQQDDESRGRGLPTEEHELNAEKRKNVDTSDGGSEHSPSKRPRLDQETHFLVMSVSLRENRSTAKELNSILLEMNWLDGSAGRDAVHQVMQFVRNKFSS